MGFMNLFALDQIIYYIYIIIYGVDSVAARIIEFL